LNQELLPQKVSGELSAGEFAMLKETVIQQKAEAEAQLAALDAKTITMLGLLEETQKNVVDLGRAWGNGSVQQKQELASGLFPDGLVYSGKLKYFEPSNVLLMDTLLEMFNPTEDEENIGAGDGI
jgi:hypothetical protein